MNGEHQCHAKARVGFGVVSHVLALCFARARYERACSAAGAKSVHQYWADRYAADPSGGVHGGAPAEGNKNLCEHRRHRLDPVAFVRLVTSLSNITDHDALELFDIFGTSRTRASQRRSLDNLSFVPSASARARADAVVGAQMSKARE